MSDQISEKMARKIYDAACLAVELGDDGEDTFITNLRAAGLIKPSKLYEVREWVNGAEHFGISNQASYRSYHKGISECAEKYEAAITEILEECDGPR